MVLRNIIVEKKGIKVEYLASWARRQMLMLLLPLEDQIERAKGWLKLKEEGAELIICLSLRTSKKERNLR